MKQDHFYPSFMFSFLLHAVVLCAGLYAAMPNPPPSKASFAPQEEIAFKPLKIRLGKGYHMQQPSPSNAAGEEAEPSILPQFKPKFSQPSAHVVRRTIDRMGKGQPSIERHVSGSQMGNSFAYEATHLRKYTEILPLWLNQFRGYPEAARAENLRGDGEIGIVIDRQGNILEANVRRSTGHEILDEELRKMLKRANPVLPVPSHYKPGEARLTFIIPMRF